MSCKKLRKTAFSDLHVNRSRRRVATRPQRRYYLVVTEDEKSSVFYLEALSAKLSPGIVQTAPWLDVRGTGFNTRTLVNAVPNIRKRAMAELRRKTGSDIISFDEVWVLFDKDSFSASDFDNAICSATAHKYNVAWSNECFELWYLLHFKDVSSPLDRKRIYDELSHYLGVSHYETLKGDDGKCLHEKMAGSPAIRVAIDRAKRLEAEATASGHPCSRRNPCTLVYKLVEPLLQFLPETCKMENA